MYELFIIVVGEYHLHMTGEYEEVIDIQLWLWRVFKVSTSIKEVV